MNFNDRMDHLRISALEMSQTHYDRNPGTSDAQVVATAEVFLKFLTQDCTKVEVIGTDVPIVIAPHSAD